MPAFSTLTETFDAVDTGKWSYPGAGSAVTGGVLQLTPTIGYPTVRTQATYDITGSSVFWEMPQIVNNGSLGTTECGSELIDAATFPNNRITFGVLNNGTLEANRRDSSTRTVMTSLAHNAVDHRWLKISESGGTITWWTSPDASTWTSFGTSAVGAMPLTGMYWSSYAGFYNAGETSPGIATFDNVNVPPGPPPISERFAPDAILAQTGLTGAVGAVQDDPDSPDGSWLVG
jgi:hypothetical protein